MNRGIEQDQGVAFGPGCQPSASAPDGSSRSGIPNAVAFWSMSRAIRHHLSTGLIYRSNPQDRMTNHPGGYTFAEVPDWQLRQWMHIIENAAQAIEARRAATGTGAVEDESAVAESDAPKGASQ